MNTPDTEWRLDPHNVKAGDRHVRLSNAVSKAQISIHEQEMYDTRVEIFNAVNELLSSRDTYWKERVRKEGEAVRNEIRLEIEEELERGGWSPGQIEILQNLESLTTTPITNEDNLK